MTDHDPKADLKCPQSVHDLRDPAGAFVGTCGEQAYDKCEGNHVP
jgi:hypothetical protein